MDAAKEKSSTERDALVGLFTSLLRPLMPLALERGISAQEVSDAVRRAYVQQLESRMGGQERKLSDARLALVAGLTRSEVGRFRSRNPVGKLSSQSNGNLEQIGEILSAWHTHPKFSGAYGLALDLDLESTPGSPRSTFAELVESVLPGANAETLLDELIAIGSVEVVDKTTVRCTSRAAVWRSSDDVTVSLIERAAKLLESAAGSFAHNLQRDLSPGDLYFDRRVISDYPLSLRDRDEFQSVAQTRGEAYVVELDSWLTKNTQPASTPTAKRYGVGVYFFEEVSTDENATEDGDPSGTHSEKRREIDVLNPGFEKA